jgi:hypothetical protein
MDLALLRRALDVEVRADRAQIATLDSIPSSASRDDVAQPRPSPGTCWPAPNPGSPASRAAQPSSTASGEHVTVRSSSVASMY